MNFKKKKAITLALIFSLGSSIVYAEDASPGFVSKKQTQAEKVLGGIGQAANAAYAKYLSTGNASDAAEIGKRLLLAQAYQAVLGPVTGALGGNGGDNATNWLTVPDYQANGTDASASGATEVNASTVEIGSTGNASEAGGAAAAYGGNGTGTAANSGGYDYGGGSGTAATGGTGSLSDSTYTPGSGAGTGLSGADGAFSGAIGGVVGGMQNQISNNAGYSVSVNGPQYVTAKVEMDPPNPLKNKPISITSSFVTLALPPSAMVVPDRTTQTETLSYDTAGTYTKTYTFGYDYYPPPDSHGNRPATQHGTVTVTAKFNVNEFSSFGGGSGGQYGDINSGGGTTVVGGLSSGGTSLNVSGSNMNGNGGYQLPQDGVLSSAASGLNSAANGLSTAAGGISDAIRSVLTGDMPVPWGRMTSGAEPTQNAISLAIPGFSGVGEGLYSVANSIQAVLGNRKSDHPAGIDAAETARAENGGKLQSDKTADQVRSEAMTDGSMNSILATASKILAARGVKATTAADFAKLYEDSPYTSPTDAWDMNRLDKIVMTKTATRIAQK